MIAVLRIAGQVKQKKKELETLNRLKLRKKFSCTLIDENDNIRMGMIKSVKDCIVYGNISDDLAKNLKKKEKNGISHLHPPRGGFKKSSKVAAPKGILGKNDDIDKLLQRML